MSFDQTLLITGAGRRIGLYVVEQFLEKGWGVCAHYYTSGATLEVLQRKWGRALLPVCADLATQTSLVERALEHFGRLDVLINNASTFVYDDIKTATPESVHQNMSVNTQAPLWLSQDFYQKIGKGTIINMIDQRVWSLTPYFTSYTMAKSALWSLTRQLALSMAPHVRVNAIGPGPTLPAEHQAAADFQRHVDQTPLKIAVPLDDIVRAMCFIIETPSFTGQMLAMDAGQHLGWTFPGAVHQMED